MDEKQQEELCELLDKNGFTDKIDITTSIALFEQGLIRNPENDFTIFYSEFNKSFQTDYISLNEVKETLEKINDGFFEYIGSSKEKELKKLDNNYLSYIIMSINQYDGLFYPENFQYDIDDIMLLLIDY